MILNIKASLLPAASAQSSHVLEDQAQENSFSRTCARQQLCNLTGEGEERLTTDM